MVKMRVVLYRDHTVRMQAIVDLDITDREMDLVVSHPAAVRRAEVANMVNAKIQDHIPQDNAQWSIREDLGPSGAYVDEIWEDIMTR